MNSLQEWQQELSNNYALQDKLISFINQYGISNIEHALHLYSNLHYEYLCKTKSSISKFDVYSIYYLKIKEHNISIYTQHGTYHKYGTLAKELKILSPYGFIKCTQSCIVSLNKIKSIQHNDIILTNGIKIHMSRSYATKVILAYSQYNPFRLES